MCDDVDSRGVNVHISITGASRPQCVSLSADRIHNHIGASYAKSNIGLVVDQSSMLLLNLR